MAAGGGSARAPLLINDGETDAGAGTTHEAHGIGMYASLLASVWARTLLARYLRLLPSVAAVLALYTYIAPFLASGPISFI